MFGSEGRLFAWPEDELGLTDTVLFSSYDATAPLKQWVARYVHDITQEGARVLGAEDTRIDGRPAVRVTIEDPVNDRPLETEAYLFSEEGELRLLEYSAPSDRFDHVQDNYRTSASSFDLD